MSIERAKLAIEIVKLAQDIWHAHSDRAQKKRDEDAAKEKRIKELEAEIERLKSKEP